MTHIYKKAAISQESLDKIAEAIPKPGKGWLDGLTPFSPSAQKIWEGSFDAHTELLFRVEGYVVGICPTTRRDSVSVYMPSDLGEIIAIIY